MRDGEGLSMFTLFAIPKPFNGHIGLIQRNAIYSWTLLRPRPEIILFGDEAGTAQICQEANLKHMPEVACNGSGVPLLNCLFEKAQNLATYDLVCYVNSDIIITQSLIDSIDVIKRQKKRFVALCTPWNLIIKNEIDFALPAWERNLRDSVRENGIAPRPVGADLFLFPRGFYHRIPPFLVGRTCFDNWLIFKTRRLKTPLIDVTPFALLVHQSHEGTTHGGWCMDRKKFLGNELIAGWWARTFVAADATHRVEADGHLRKKSIFELIKPRLEAILNDTILNKLVRLIGYLRRKLNI